MTNNTFIILDAPAVLHRAWHALPKLTSPKGITVNALYGFSVLLLKIIREFQPEYLTCAFDYPGPTFRHKIYKDYKATRIPQPQEFYDQIPLSKKLLDVFKIKSWEQKGYEADDIIAQLKNSTPPKILKIIVTGDTDSFQLIDKQTKVYFLKRGINKIQIYDENAVKEQFGLTPKQLIDFKSLKGDPSDNIPGIPGIGEKTALQLLKKFGTIENIYEHLKLPENFWQIKPSLGKSLLKNKEKVVLAKNLIELKNNKKIKADYKECQVKPFDLKEVKKFLEEFGFKSLISKIESLPKKKQSKLL